MPKPIVVKGRAAAKQARKDNPTSTLLVTEDDGSRWLHEPDARPMRAPYYRAPRYTNKEG